MDSGAEKIFLVDWKDLDSASSNSSSSTVSQTQTSSTALADELKNGNSQVSCRTWKSSNGKTITITSDGIIEPGDIPHPIGFSECKTI